MPLLLGFNNLNAQKKAEQDSMKTYNLEEIIIYPDSKKADEKKMHRETSFKTIYGNDAAKELTGESGIIVHAPFLSTLRIHGLPEPLSGFYHSNIRVAGRVTQLQGAYSIINPDLFELELEKVSYSSRYDDLGGIIKIKPIKYQPRKIELKFSSDLLQRIATLIAPVQIGEINLQGKTFSSIRNIESSSILENAIPDLRLLPRILEFQNYSSFNIGKTNLEIILRKAAENNDYDEEIRYGISKVSESSVQDFFALNYLVPIQDLNFESSFGYEYDRLSSEQKFHDSDNELEIGTKNFNLAFELSERNKIYSLGMNAYFMRTNNLNEIKDLDVLRLWGEAKYVYSGLLLKPSLGLTKFHNKFANLHSLNISYFPEESEITFGYSHLANFLVHNNGLIGSVFRQNQDIHPQTADHYSLLVNFKKENKFFDALEVLFYKKDFEADFNGEYSEGYVAGIDFWLGKNTEFYYKFISSLSKSRINNHEIPGAVDKNFQLDLGYKLFDNLEMTAQLRYQDGFYYKNKIKSSYEKLNNSVYFNFGGRISFDIMNKKADIMFTLYNLLAPLGQKNEIARFENSEGELRSVSTPLWPNIGFSFKL